MIPARPKIPAPLASYRTPAQTRPKANDPRAPGPSATPQEIPPQRPCHPARLLVTRTSGKVSGYEPGLGRGRACMATPGT